MVLWLVEALKRYEQSKLLHQLPDTLYKWQDRQNVWLGEYFVQGKEECGGQRDGNEQGREHLSEMAAFVVQQGER